MRTGNQQKRESEILAQFSQEVGRARKNIDAIISIAERRGLDKNSQEYAQIRQLREFFASIQAYVQKDSGWTGLIFSVKPAYEKLNAGDSWWPALTGEYAAALSYEFHAVLDTILSVGKKLVELPKGSLTLPQSKSLAQFASDQSYSNSIKAISNSIAHKLFATLESEPSTLDKSESSTLDDFTCIEESKLTSKQTETLELMAKLTGEMVNPVLGEPRGEFLKIHKTLKAYEAFQTTHHKNVFLEFTDRFQGAGPISIVNKMTTFSKMLKEIEPVSIETYLSDSKLPMIFVNEKGVKSTYRHFVVEQENEISKLALDFKKSQSYYLVPLCYSFSNEYLLEIRMNRVWPQSLEDKRKMLENLSGNGDAINEFKNHSQKFLDDISLHMDRSEAESHIELGYLRANQVAQETLKKEIEVLDQENALNFIKSERSLIHEFLHRQESLLEKINDLFKNNYPHEDLISIITSLKSEVTQHENQRKRLLKNEDAKWASMQEDPEFSKHYEAYQKDRSLVEFSSNLESKADNLNQLLLNNLGDVIAVNADAIARIKKTLETFNRSYGEYQDQKSQVASPSKSVSQHYQTRSRIAKNHAMKSIPFEAYLEQHFDLLEQIEHEVSQRKETLVTELDRLGDQQSILLQEKDRIDLELKSIVAEKEELKQLEANSSYAKVAFTYLAGFVSDSFSKTKQTHAELDEKIHSLHQNLANIDEKLKENAGCIEAKKEYQQEFIHDSEHLLSMDRIVLDVTRESVESHRLELEAKEAEYNAEFERMYTDIKRPFLKGATLDDTYEEIKRLQNTLEKENEYFSLKQQEHKEEVLLKQQIIDNQKKAEILFQEKVTRIQERVNALSAHIGNELQVFGGSDIHGDVADNKSYISMKEIHLYKLGVMLSNESSDIRESLEEAFQDGDHFEKYKDSILNQLGECKNAILNASKKWHEMKEGQKVVPKSRAGNHSPLINASVILERLREIGTRDISLIEMKTQAKEVISSMLPAINDLSELLKFKELVDTKHLGVENPYAYIREERHAFRAKYGNTETWNYILGAIQVKLQEQASQNPRITDAQYRAFYDIMKTRRSHTYGLGGMFQNLGGNARGWKNPDDHLAAEEAVPNQSALGLYKK